MEATEAGLDRSALGELSSSFAGELVTPGHPTYEEHLAGLSA